VTVLATLEVWMGPDRPIRLHDTFDMWVPRFKVISGLIWDAGLPAWNPMMLSGNLALLQHFNPFHFFTLLSGLFPLWLSFSIYQFIVYFIACYGMHLYLSKSLKVSHRASFVGSLLFLTLSLHIGLDHLFNFAFPLFLFLFQKAFSEKSEHRWQYFLGLFLLIICSSIPLTVPYFLVFHFALILCEPSSKRNRFLFGFVCFWGAYALIHAPTIYSLISEAAFSHREGGSAISSSLLMAFLKGVIRSLRETPAVYVVPFALMVCSLFLALEKKVLKWWLILLAFFLVKVFFSYQGGQELLSQFGFLKTLNWSRFFSLTHFLIVSVLAAYGVQWLEAIGNKSRLKYIIPCLFLIIVGIFYLDAHTSTWMQPAGRDSKLLLNTKIFIFLISIFVLIKLNKSFFLLIKRNESLFQIVILLYILLFTKYFYMKVFETQSFNGYFRNAEIEKIVQREGGSQYRSVFFCNHNADISCFFSALLPFHGVEDPSGYSTMYPRRYKELWEKMLHPDVPQSDCQVWRNDIKTWGNRVYLPICGNNAFAKINFDLLSLLNVKYILSRSAGIDQQFPGSLKLHSFSLPKVQVRLNWIQKIPVKILSQEEFLLGHEPQTWVYELKNTLPRSFIVDTWKVMENSGELLDVLARKSAFEHLHSALLLSSDIQSMSLPPLKSPVQSKTRVLEYILHLVTTKDQN